jgi:hypothetical protein
MIPEPTENRWNFSGTLFVDNNKQKMNNQKGQIRHDYDVAICIGVALAANLFIFCWLFFLLV